MSEWLMIALMTTGVAGFAIGGTGFRWVRFAIMPLIWGVICFYDGIFWGRDLGMALSLGVALTLAYGEKVPYWRKFVLFLGYSIATLWIGFSWWQLLSPLLILLFFFLSNWKPTSNIFPWKICEASFGLFLSFIPANIISMRH